MGKFIDISGQQFGNWKVLEYNKDKRKWVCECQCEKHTIKLIDSADLRKGKTTNCGCLRRKDLTGMEFKHLIVDSYAGDYHWNCHCKECGKKFIVHTYHLEHGNIPNCTHSELHTNVKDINGMIFGDWKVISYAGHKYWNCECQCSLHTRRKVLGRDLRNGYSKSCGLDKPGAVALMNSDSNFKDITGQQFGEWTTLEYSGNGYWKCRCSCGAVKNVKGAALRCGSTKSCGHNSGVLKDIKNKKFGELTAIEYIGNGIWKCKCSCGNEVSIHGHYLRSGHTKSCGASIHRYIDIKNQRFGKLVAKDYIGCGKWRCQCDCGNTVDVYGVNLRSHGTRSCGCATSEMRINTLINNGQLDYRTKEQIDALKSENNLRKFLGDQKLTLTQIAKKLGISYTYLIAYIKNKYNIEDLIDYTCTESELETDVYDYIKSICNTNVERHNRSILHGQELDIYIPEKKIAIEFNGTYWHSESQKPIKYHQNKTVECAKQGIRLIHIFEYEWIDNINRSKLTRYLYDIVNNDTLDKLYARKLTVKEVSTEDKDEFETEYHLQSSAHSEINIGIYNNTDLVGIMTFGKPRFNKNYQYELIRMCFKSYIKIIGGAERMFSYFVNKYKPTSIITYCDISKFTGKAYLKLGFKTDKDSLTSPNYVWISSDRNNVIHRYQTQKHKLIAQGIGTENQTEDEIMTNLGYIKVYDCGNLKFEWEA